MIYGVLMQLYD